MTIWLLNRYHNVEAGLQLDDDLHVVARAVRAVQNATCDAAGALVRCPCRIDTFDVYRKRGRHREILRELPWVDGARIINLGAELSRP